MKNSPAAISGVGSGRDHAFDPAAFTRIAFNKHRTTSRWSTAGDVYQTFLGIVVILMYAGSLFYGMQQDLVVDSAGLLTRPLTSEDLARVPAAVAMDLLLLLASAYGLLIACRTGPVAVDRAQGYWWLSLPVDRRKLVRGPIMRKLVWAASVAGLMMVPMALLSDPANGFLSMLLASLTTSFLVAVVFAAATAIQLLKAQRMVEACIRGLSAVVLMVLLLPLVAPQSGGFLGGLSSILSALPTSWPLAVAQGSVWPVPVMFGLAAAGGIAVHPRLGGLHRPDMVAAGAVTGHAGSALYFGDFRELGQALQVDRGTKTRFRIPRRVPASATGVLVFTDLLAFLRRPHMVASLLGMALLPGAASLVEGLGSAVLVGVVLFFTGWRVAVVSSTIAREHAERPALDRLLPLDASTQLRLHAVVPLLAAGAWGLVAFSLLAFLGASGGGLDAVALVGMGLLSSFGVAAAGMRMAHRPGPDWTSLEGTPSSVLQSNGAISSYTRGPDFLFLAMLPVMAVLLTGAFNWWLVLLQCATTLVCLWLSTRRD